MTGATTSLRAACPKRPAALLSVVVLGACAAPTGGVGPGVATRAPPASTAFEAPLQRDGLAYRAELRGRALAVTRESGPFHFSEGRAAADVAAAFCARSGRSLRRSLRDAHERGVWIYPEGCA